MSNFNYREVSVDGKTFYFVARGKSKLPSDEEVRDFINSLKSQNNSVEFTVPSEREKVFSMDLKQGLTFCASKYGVSKDKVVKEAARVFPSLNLTTLRD